MTASNDTYPLLRKEPGTIWHYSQGSWESIPIFSAAPTTIQHELSSIDAVTLSRIRAFRFHSQVTITGTPGATLLYQFFAFWGSATETYLSPVRTTYIGTAGSLFIDRVFEIDKPSLLDTGVYAASRLAITWQLVPSVGTATLVAPELSLIAYRNNSVLI
jgi:hypothetical protein